MIVLITGASHTGKTYLSQKLLEKYKYPYMSVDHIKMGLIRSKNTKLTPTSLDAELTEYLWPVICEIIKTAIENNQNLIIEGCYIPLDYKKYFSIDYLKNIKLICLVMSKEYIINNFDKIIAYENIIEKRLCSDCTIDGLIADNLKILKEAEQNNIDYMLIDDKYDLEIEL